MRYRHITDNCFASQIGEMGLSADAYQSALAESGLALEQLRRWHAAGDMPFLTLPERRDDLDVLSSQAARLRGSYARLVIFGIGGSSLGGQALVALADARGDGPELLFIDNPDPKSFETTMGEGDLKDTGFLVISKSGSTAETLAQTMLALELAEPKRFLFVTEPGESPLRRLAARFGIPTLDHDPCLGGRFSVLSVVGLLPALVAGLDARAVRDGAEEVLHATLGASSPDEAPVAVGAAIGHGLLREQGISMTVLMPYVDRLYPYGLWFRQLWAESLGKRRQGTTPVLARGATDQHSQLQLYLDGPHDKMFTLLALDRGNAGPSIDAGLARDLGADYLAGKSLSDVFAAEAHATAESLAAAGRPVRTLHLPKVDEAALGALMMHAMLETVVTALALGVDAFDQPAVEHGKMLARHYLSGESS